MSRERRSAPRKAARDPVSVTDCISGEVIGRIGDLSRNGMMLICRRPLKDGAIYQLRFRLHDTDADTETGAQTMWVEPAHLEGYQWSGLRIISISAPAADALDRWLKDESMRHPR